MNYQETLSFLYQQLPMYQRVGKSAFKKDLGNIIAFCEYLNQPHQNFKSIHIAGTNGKGSTTHMLGAILQAHGLKVGLYTSPHYKDFRERIKINGEYIPEQNVIDFVANHKNFIQKVKPSYFEMTVAMAFEYFSNEKVDIAIIETGLGGRLDSTNIITPILSVITNISFDHMNMLGNTIPLIASEKAGIIKKNTPAVIGETQTLSKPVFIEKAKITNASITFADQRLSAKVVETYFHKTIYNIYDSKQNLGFNNLILGLLGNYQSKNLVTTLEAIQILNDTYDLNITEQKIRQGLENIKSLTNIIGRWEILSELPLTLADSAHNESGIKSAMRQLTSLKYDQLHIVMGVVNDKDLIKILPLFPKTASYYFAKPNIIRGLNADTLQTQAALLGLNGKTYDSVPLALKMAQSKAENNDIIFVGGSTFTVAEVV